MIDAHVESLLTDFEIFQGSLIYISQTDGLFYEVHFCPSRLLYCTAMGYVQETWILNCDVALIELIGLILVIIRSINDTFNPIPADNILKRVLRLFK